MQDVVHAQYCRLVTYAPGELVVDHEFRKKRECMGELTNCCCVALGKPSLNVCVPWSNLATLSKSSERKRLTKTDWECGGYNQTKLPHDHGRIVLAKVMPQTSNHKVTSEDK